MPEDIFETSKQNKNRKIFAIFILILVLLLLIYSTIYLNNKFNFNKDNITEYVSQKFLNSTDLITTNNRSNEGLHNNAVRNTTGNSKNNTKLLFVASVDSSKYAPTLRVYDLNANSISKIKKFNNSSIIEFANNNNDAVAVIIRKEDLDRTNSIYKSSRFYLDSDFLQDFSLRNAREIHNITIKPYYIRHLSICGKRVFFAGTMNAGNNGLPPFTHWNIYVLDVTNGNVNAIANGIEPNCIDENTVLYLGKDGLYVYNMKTNSKTILRKLNRVPDYHFVTLSANKQIIFWSFPNDKLVRILQILSYNPVILRDVKLYKNIVALNPVLSKEGKNAFYLGTKDIQAIKNGLYDDIRLYMMNTATGKRYLLDFPIHNFEEDSLRLLNVLN